MRRTLGKTGKEEGGRGRRKRKEKEEEEGGRGRRERKRKEEEEEEEEGGRGSMCRDLIGNKGTCCTTHELGPLSCFYSILTSKTMILCRNVGRTP
jgi:hypothetical protein